MEEFRTPLSRAEEILENILGADNELQDPLSNVEEILLSILNDTPYTKEPETLIEEMLLAIKEGTEMDAIAKNRVEEILLAIIHGEEYTKLPLSRFEELLIEWLKESAVTEKFLDLAPILSFSDSAGKPLVECKVKIEPVQDLHGYDNPWPAGGGKNLLDPSTVPNENMYIRWQDGTTASPSSSTADWRHTDYIPIEENTEYFIGEAYGNATTAGSVWYNADKQYISGFSTANLKNNNGVETSPVNAAYLRHSFSIADGYNPNWQNTVYIIKNSDPHEFTPYSNICPISGHTKVNVVRAGKNLFDGSILVEKVAWQYIELPLKEGTYTFSCTLPTNTAEFVLYFRKEGSSTSSVTRAYLGHPVTITLNEGENAEIQYRRVSGTGVFSDYTYQLELGSTATSYEPYQGETYTIDLGDTIYGGERDVTTGKLTAYLAMVDLGSLEWVMVSTGTYPYFRCNNSNIFFGSNQSILCSVYKNLGSMGGSAFGELSRESGYSRGVFTNASFFKIRDMAYSDVDSFKTAVTGQKLLYELAEPIEIQLTPQQITTLLGGNTLYADTGDISVKYLAKKS